MNEGVSFFWLFFVILIWSGFFSIHPLVKWMDLSPMPPQAGAIFIGSEWYWSPARAGGWSANQAKAAHRQMLCARALSSLPYDPWLMDLLFNTRFVFRLPHQWNQLDIDAANIHTQKTKLLPTSLALPLVFCFTIALASWFRHFATTATAVCIYHMHRFTVFDYQVGTTPHFVLPRWEI